MRRLCEFLSKPRSDHLESVFVCLLNNTLNDMEDAAQPQSKRPRRNNERLSVSKRKRPNDAERRRETNQLPPGRVVPALQSLTLCQVDWCNETVDLTGCDDCKEQKQNDSKGTEKEPFIALEDTTSAFIESFFWNSLLRGCSGEAR